ncbi:unnamed protein product [Bursaphelenchus okinawaensis]|uniref:RING-type domain-containing protein n=1 Tax=Bursaphelenchus okinawaensis TaxID=465554 RepID=A0A811KMI3_9BILA|nr:unnamed protein product [Bursaphelenchus okinawaensis]CAG9107732.1 unnamed protein product [Bursaphelenchus okinawaensis]
MADNDLTESISLAESINVDKLLQKLECPVCFQLCSPPFFQCKNGHILCNCCLDNVKNCPLCRQPHGVSRSRALEEMVEMFQFPCAYKAQGCSAVMKFSEKGQHDETCAYQNVEVHKIEELVDNALENQNSKGVPVKLLFRRQPGKVPVVFIPYFAEKTLNHMKINKFLIDDTQAVSYLYALVRSRLKIKKNEAIFLMVGGTNLVLQSVPIGALYQTMQADNGILYVTYCSQPTFG